MLHKVFCIYKYCIHTLIIDFLTLRGTIRDIWIAKNVYLLVIVMYIVL